MLAGSEKLIIALDVSSRTSALALVEQLGEFAAMFKIGSQLYAAEGPDIVREIVLRGCRIFLDLKFHDIPNTVSAAALEVMRLGVSMMTIHALGGRQMMQNVIEQLEAESKGTNRDRPKVIAVTVLTSANASQLAEMGLSDPQSLVLNLSRLAKSCGVDGVVASTREIETIRTNVKQDGFLIVTPGIRPIGSSLDDQERIATPAEAVRAGADYIVVGRPIIGAKSPRQAALDMIKEIQIARPAQFAQPAE